jgi:hypothetical protein
LCLFFYLPVLEHKTWQWGPSLSVFSSQCIIPWDLH